MRDPIRDPWVGMLCGFSGTFPDEDLYCTDKPSVAIWVKGCLSHLLPPSLRDAFSLANKYFSGNLKANGGVSHWACSVPQVLGTAVF